MTELEAINTLLSVIGEAPIDRLSDISVNEITDSALARKVLGEVERDCLIHFFHNLNHANLGSLQLLRVGRSFLLGYP